MLNSSNQNAEGQGALKDFQTTQNIKDKGDKSFGLKVAKQIASDLKGDYLVERNKRFAINRRLANGKGNVDDVKKAFHKDGELKYTHLSIKAMMLIATTVARTVQRWMQNNEKIVVTAEDPISLQQKKDEVDRAEFVMNHGKMIAQAVEASGVPLVKPDQFVPEDPEELEEWQSDEQKLDEEIKQQTAINKVFADNGWFDTIKKTVLTDSAEVGLLAGEVKTMRDGMILIKKLKPESVFSSHTEFEDHRDTSYRGYKESLKIIDLREEYPEIDEDKYWELAKTSTNYKSGVLGEYFDNSWYTMSERPYDDWVVSTITFYLKTSDSDGYQMKVTKGGTLMIDKKDTPPPPTSNKKYIKKDKYSIYKGVFVEGTEIMLEWGLQKNMIRPQDPQEIGDVEFPISMYMYNMYEMRNLALPEKIEDAAEQLHVIRVKMQQLINKMRPAGNAFDIDALQELDMGLGENKKFSPLELQDLHDQSGNFYFRGRDAEGRPIEFPIRPMPNSEALPQLQALMAADNHWVNIIREATGSNENAEGQSAKPRVTNDNYQASLAVSFNATDYMYDSYLWLMEDLGKKIGCLLHDAAMFGGKKYKDILSKEDVKGRVFSTKAKMLATQEETAYIDSLLTNAIQTNPQFVLYCNPLQIRRLAKEDPKIAERRFLRAQRNAIKGQMEQASNQASMNAEAQAKSGMQVAQAQAQVQAEQAQFKQQEIALTGENANKTAVINMFTSLYSKGVGMPSELVPLGNAVIQNIMLPLLIANEEQRNQVMAQMQQQQAQQQQQLMQPQQPQQQEQMEQPLQQEQQDITQQG